MIEFARNHQDIPFWKEFFYKWVGGFAALLDGLVSILSLGMLQSSFSLLWARTWTRWKYE